MLSTTTAKWLGPTHGHGDWIFLGHFGAWLSGSQHRGYEEFYVCGGLVVSVYPPLMTSIIAVRWWGCAQIGRANMEGEVITISLCGARKPGGGTKATGVTWRQANGKHRLRALTISARSWVSRQGPCCCMESSLRPLSDSRPRSRQRLSHQQSGPNRGRERRACCVVEAGPLGV